MTRSRGRSPTWHRRARRHRSQARQLLQRWKKKKVFNSKQADLLLLAQSRLGAHHSRVQIRLSPKQFWAMSRRSSQWYGSTRWNQWSPQNPQAPKQGKNKPKKGEQGKDPQKKDGLSADYDASPWLPGSSDGASSSTDAKARELMDVFLQMAKDKQELPDQIQKILQPDIKEDLRDKQKQLNKHRNVLQKIEAKKRAIQKDQEQWQSWLVEVKQTIAKQKQKHEENVMRLEGELQNLQKQEEDIRLQRETPEKDMEMKEEDGALDADALVESLISDEEKSIPDKPKQEVAKMKEKLEQEYAAKLVLAQQEIHQHLQIQYKQELDKSIMELHMVNNLGSAVNGGKDGPKAAVAPFGRKSRMEALAPYAKDAKDSNQPSHVQTMQSLLEQTHGRNQDPPAAQSSEEAKTEE